MGPRRTRTTEVTGRVRNSFTPRSNGHFLGACWTIPVWLLLLGTGVRVVGAVHIELEMGAAVHRIASAQTSTAITALNEPVKDGRFEHNNGACSFDNEFEIGKARLAISEFNRAKRAIVADVTRSLANGRPVAHPLDRDAEQTSDAVLNLILSGK